MIRRRFSSCTDTGLAILAWQAVGNMKRVGYLLAVQGITAAILGAGLVSAVPARADCVSSGGTTLCSQGDVRGGDTGAGPGSMGSSYTPYICGYDGDCDDWGWYFDVDVDRPGIGGPGGPGIGGPGGPGIGGPGFGGGGPGIGGGGGGRR